MIGLSCHPLKLTPGLANDSGVDRMLSAAPGENSAMLTGDSDKMFQLWSVAVKGKVPGAPGCLPRGPRRALGGSLLAVTPTRGCLALGCSCPGLSVLWAPSKAVPPPGALCLSSLLALFFSSRDGLPIASVSDSAIFPQSNLSPHSTYSGPFVSHLTSGASPDLPTSLLPSFSSQETRGLGLNRQVPLFKQNL